jgi:hypothetical protein
MVNSAQANWNLIRIVYGSGDPSIMMTNKECIYLFHWIQMLDRHTKQLIKFELQDQHNVFYH